MKFFPETSKEKETVGPLVRPPSLTSLLVSAVTGPSSLEQCFVSHMLSCNGTGQDRGTVEQLPLLNDSEIPLLAMGSAFSQS